MVRNAVRLTLGQLAHHPSPIPDDAGCDLGGARCALQERGREEGPLTAVTVWKFDDPAGAVRAWTVLKGAEEDGLVRVLDHAVVSWPEGADKPDSDVGHEARWGGAAWGGFFGVMIGMLFLVPVVGGLVGAAIGAAAKAMEGTGISRSDLEKIREQVTPGTSALFLVTEEADLDRVGERFHGIRWTLMSTNLTEPERKVLVETFGGE